MRFIKLRDDIEYVVPATGRVIYPDPGRLRVINREGLIIQQGLTGRFREWEKFAPTGLWALEESEPGSDPRKVAPPIRKRIGWNATLQMDLHALKVQRKAEDNRVRKRTEWVSNANPKARYALPAPHHRVGCVPERNPPEIVEIDGVLYKRHAKLQIWEKIPNSRRTAPKATPWPDTRGPLTFPVTNRRTGKKMGVIRAHSKSEAVEILQKWCRQNGESPNEIAIT